MTSTVSNELSLGSKISAVQHKLDMLFKMDEFMSKATLSKIENDICRYYPPTYSDSMSTYPKTDHKLFALCIRFLEPNDTLYSLLEKVELFSNQFKEPYEAEIHFLSEVWQMFKEVANSGVERLNISKDKAQKDQTFLADCKLASRAISLLYQAKQENPSNQHCMVLNKPSNSIYHCNSSIPVVKSLLSKVQSSNQITSYFIWDEISKKYPNVNSLKQEMDSQDGDPMSPPTVIFKANTGEKIPYNDILTMVMTAIETRDELSKIITESHEYKSMESQLNILMEEYQC